MKSVLGTGIFMSRAKAIQYYAQYSPDETLEEISKQVYQKVADGEITIDPNPTRPDLFLNLEEGRYYQQVH
jgi:hypothetical protein